LCILIRSSFYQRWIGIPLISRGDNRESTSRLIFFKIFFSRTSIPISIELGTNYLWVKRILNCSNEGPCPLQSGDNYKNAKLGWGHLKTFSRTTKPEELIFT
jgi:hypothetical protein